MSVAELKHRVTDTLKRQGYSVTKDGHLSLKGNDREARRTVHDLAKKERLSIRRDFIGRFASVAGSMLPDGASIEVEKIAPVLIEIHADTVEEEFFRWWNLVWWSLPYERAYGRQMRYLIWDSYHNAVIGLIGLQSPILSWSVRDEYLGIEPDQRDYWVNQSMSAQRLGAIPPYNLLLGGKLVGSLMASDEVRSRFHSKYHNVETVMSNRVLPARLLFITTTGAYGKSSVYQRLKFHDQKVAEFIGYSHGSGSFHIPDSLYETLLLFLENRDHNVARGYGTGPSRKLRLIDTALNLLGFQNGVQHGVNRAIYLFPMAKNLTDVIKHNKRPLWYSRSAQELISFWKDRWAIPRSIRDDSYLKFKANDFMRELERTLQGSK